MYRRNTQIVKVARVVQKLLKIAFYHILEQHVQPLSDIDNIFNIGNISNLCTILAILQILEILTTLSILTTLAICVYHIGMKLTI